MSKPPHLGLLTFSICPTLSQAQDWPAPVWLLGSLTCLLLQHWKSLPFPCSELYHISVLRPLLMGFFFCPEIKLFLQERRQKNTWPVIFVGNVKLYQNNCHSYVCFPKEVNHLSYQSGGKGLSHALVTTELYSKYLPLLLDASCFQLFPSSVDMSFFP